MAAALSRGRLQQSRAREVDLGVDVDAGEPGGLARMGVGESGGGCQHGELREHRRELQARRASGYDVLGVDVSGCDHLRALKLVLPHHDQSPSSPGAAAASVLPPSLVLSHLPAPRPCTSHKRTSHAIARP